VASVIHVYGRKGPAREPMLIPDVDFAGMSAAVGAQGVVVRTLEDLDELAVWAARPSSERPFLLLDLRVSPAVVAPHQEEIFRANSLSHFQMPGARVARGSRGGRACGS
jgi:acetolactate synthase I/II/III large subunit